MTVRLEVSEGIATLTLDRPDKLNAMSDEMYDLLHDHSHALSADPAVRAIGSVPAPAAEIAKPAPAAEIAKPAADATKPATVTGAPAEVVDVARTIGDVPQ